jgi:hypothetical protein
LTKSGLQHIKQVGNAAKSERNVGKNLLALSAVERLTNGGWMYACRPLNR